MPKSTNARTSAPDRLAGFITRALLSAALLALVCCLLATASPMPAAAASSGSALLPAGTMSGQTYSLQSQDEPAPPSPLLYLDIWLFGGLVLLVALIVGIKYLWKAFQPDNRDPAEGLQPWERPDYDDEQSG
ncbi:MAG: hypothetical protein OXR67_03160 [Chloroflexota bacterium]|nr:hypothetical protein [Chloroflexota bacterium]